jgi:hypothetical protein
MIFRPRHLLIRWILPHSWRANPGQRVRVLQEFAQTELDSAWQSIYALERVSDPELRRQLFRHALEELFHGDLFRAEAFRQAASLPEIPLTRREPLLELRAGAPRTATEFFAYLAIGEEEIAHDFDAYESSLPDAEVRRIFAAIRADEGRHAEDSAASLERLAAAGGVSLAWLRLRHLAGLASRRYSTLLNKAGVIPMTAALFAAYITLGAFFAGQARRRLRQPGVPPLEALRQQQAALDASLRSAP